MASFLQRMILIAVIFTIIISISMGHRDISENESDCGDDLDIDYGDYSEIGNDDGDDSQIEHYLKDLCSNTKHPKQSWKIIKPEKSRFTDTNSLNVARVVFDLAIAKSNEINDKLNQLHHDSRDNALKGKYNSCSKNYKDAYRKLKIAKTDLGGDDCRKIPSEIDDVVQELRSCRHSFHKKSSDPAHIRDRNKEFELYVELVRTATNRFLSDRKTDNTRRT